MVLDVRRVHTLLFRLVPHKNHMFRLLLSHKDHIVGAFPHKNWNVWFLRGEGWRGGREGWGKPIHLSLQALAGATAAALQRRKRRRRRREGCSICGSSTSESEGQVKKAREGWLLFRGSSTVHKHLCPRIQLRCLPKLPPPGRRAAAKGATDKSAAAGSEFNTFPVAAAEAATQICAEHSD